MTSPSSPGKIRHVSRVGRLLAPVAVTALVAGAGCTSPPAPRATTTTTAPATVASSTTTTDPGTLPQTDALPPASSPGFTAAMTALWNGIVADSVAAAVPAFFPESAYLQVKTVADPAADFQNRLVAEYGADIGAAHGLLTPPADATLVQVVVPEQYAHWVPPGVCSNRVGYYEVANARVVYREGGDVRSFGIA
ncbi:MAG TPA: hypothetical protein VE991_01100, partial [Acidimicrobiales bacterium]|nr:hypothetical protein [Acidimicrobiales bacterium]